MTELTGNPAASAIIAWYLLNNLGDEISFVSDSYDDWPFSSGSKSDLSSYPDVTDRLVGELVSKEILRDDGFLHVDDDEPDTCFTRDIRNAWYPKDPS